MTIKEARKELKRIGTSNATGDALRFMYTGLIAFEACLSSDIHSVAWPADKIFAELQTYADNDIRVGYKEVGDKWKS